MNKKIAIVVSRFNEPVTSKLKEGAISELKKHGVKEQAIAVFDVPGAVEIPLLAKKLAQTKQYAAIITLGAVIRGETDHYDYVCQQVSYGCQQVALDEGIPVLFGILTTQNPELAFIRAETKGQETAQAALEMIALIDKLFLEQQDPVLA